MNIKTRTSLVLGGVLALALLATGCSSGNGTGGGGDFSDATTESQTFPFSGQELTIDAGTSELFIVAGDVSEVTVSRQMKGTANGENPEVVQTLEGDQLSLSVDCNGLSLGCDARFSVTVPSSVAVTAQNKNSRIDVSDMSADLTVAAVDGDAQLANISSPNLVLNGKDMTVSGEGLAAKSVSSDTRNGDIDLSFTAAPDRTDLVSKKGNVRLALPSADYRVSVETKNGKEDVSVSKSDSSEHLISVTTRGGDIAIVPAT